MATVAAEVIPKELLATSRKVQVIEYIRATALPSRFRRRLLQDWAEATQAQRPVQA